MIFITLLYLIYDVLWYLLKKSNNGYSQMELGKIFVREK